jgi:hypothetical protein
MRVRRSRVTSWRQAMTSVATGVTEVVETQADDQCSSFFVRTADDEDDQPRDQDRWTHWLVSARLASLPSVRRAKIACPSLTFPVWRWGLLQTLWLRDAEDAVVHDLRHLTSLQTLTLEYDDEGISYSSSHMSNDTTVALTDSLIALRVANLRLINAWVDACRLLNASPTLRRFHARECLFRSPHWCTDCLASTHEIEAGRTCHSGLWHSPSPASASSACTVFLEPSQKVCLMCATAASCRLEPASSWSWPEL